MRLLCVLVSVLALLGCPKPSITFFKASATSVEKGGQVSLSWQASTPCTLSPLVGSVDVEGSAQLSLDQTTTFQLACSGAIAEVTVEVLAPRIVSFTAPDTAPVDSMVTLSWVSERTSSCRLTPGIGAVATTGTATALLQATTEFQLTCDGLVASRVVTATSNSALPAPTDVRATPLDGEVTLSWTQTGGNSADVYLGSESPVTKQRNEFVYRSVSSPLTVAGLINGHTYYFRVVAKDGTTQSDLSAEASATPQDAPLADPLFPLQWHLLNTAQNAGARAGDDINVLGAWDAGFRGEGVRVALVDDGADPGHEDLRQNLATQESHAYVTFQTRQTDHGTACAGLIAARDFNGKGGRGVAPRASLVAYNLLLSSSSTNSFDAMTRDAVKNAVSSNSWGDSEDGTGLLTDADPLWLSGVEQGVRVGRHGLGTVYVWAAGNGGDSRYVDDVNYDRQSNQRYTVSVAGVGDDGTKASYSEEGACVWVSAPTEGDTGNGLVTTDITGLPGFNDGHTAGELPNGGLHQCV